MRIAEIFAIASIGSSIHVRTQIVQIWTVGVWIDIELAFAQIGGSGSPRLLRSLISGTSIRFVRVRSYDRPGRSIVTVLLETSM
jgi:hypothetical protein